MDHTEAVEALELAAVEPDGLARLEAGDTPASAALASHIVACRVCSAELVRLRRMSAVLRTAIGESAPADLRERTLRYVHELGRPRPAAAAERPAAPGVAAAAMAGAGGEVATGPGAPAASTEVAGGAGGTGRRSGLTLLRRTGPGGRLDRAGLGRRLAALAAAVVLLVGVGGLWAVEEGRLSDTQHAYDGRVDSLARLVDAESQMAARPDVQRVALTSATGTARGSLMFSTASGEFIMVATGLSQPGSGQVMRCWLERPTGRQPLGELSFEAGVGYWWGWPSGLGSVPAGSRFGVSVVSVGSAGSGQPVLSGVLGS